MRSKNNLSIHPQVAGFLNRVVQFINHLKYVLQRIMYMISHQTLVVGFSELNVKLFKVYHICEYFGGPDKGLEFYQSCTSQITPMFPSCQLRQLQYQKNYPHNRMPVHRDNNNHAF